MSGIRLWSRSGDNKSALTVYKLTRVNSKWGGDYEIQCVIFDLTKLWATSGFKPYFCRIFLLQGLCKVSLG